MGEMGYKCMDMGECSPFGAGLSAPECQKCIQDQMIINCNPAFEKMSGIDACPPPENSKLYSLDGHVELPSSGLNVLGVGVTFFVVGSMIAAVVGRARRGTSAVETVEVVQLVES